MGARRNRPMLGFCVRPAACHDRPAPLRKFWRFRSGTESRGRRSGIAGACEMGIERRRRGWYRLAGPLPFAALLFFASPLLREHPVSAQMLGMGMSQFAGPFAGRTAPGMPGALAPYGAAAG